MGKDKKYRLVLGSQSPRRKELLGWIDVPFDIITSQAEEHSDAKDPVKYCEDIAHIKGQDVFSKLEDKSSSLVVSSDTMVFLGDEILGKPKDRNQAKEMLQMLSGQTHKVVTSVLLKTAEKEKVFSIESHVTFDNIDPKTLELYLDSEESLDKAGAYGIQGKGLIFISHLEGSYSNVVGFPLNDFIRELKIFLEVGSDDWRQYFV
jgi:septum formation protein